MGHILPVLARRMIRQSESTEGKSTDEYSMFCFKRLIRVFRSLSLICIHLKWFSLKQVKQLL